jgi:WD40 repeat protein
MGQLALALLLFLGRSLVAHAVEISGSQLSGNDFREIVLRQNPIPKNARYQLGRIPPYMQAAKPLCLSNDGGIALFHDAHGVQIAHLCKSHVMSCQFGREKKVLEAIFSPDYTLVAVRAESRRRDHAFLHSIQESHTQRKVAAAQNEGEDEDVIYIGQVATGRLLLTLCKTSTTLSHLSFSPDGKRLVTFANTTLILWDLNNGERRKEIGGINCAAISPDSAILVTGTDDGAVVFWDIISGRRIKSGKIAEGPVRTLAFSPDSAVLFCGESFGDESNSQTRVLAWDIRAERIRWESIAHRGSHTKQFTVSKNGSILVSEGNDASLFAWNAVTGDLLHCVMSTESESGLLVRSHVLSSDGTKLIWCDWLLGQAAGPFREWNFRLKKEFASWGGTVGPIRMMAMSNDNKTLTSLSEHICQWDLATKAILDRGRTLFGSVASIEYSPNGSYFGVLDSFCALGVWEARSGQKVIAAIDGCQGPIHYFHFSRHGDSLLTVGKDAIVRLWDLPGGRVVRQFQIGNVGLARKWNDKQGASYLTSTTGKCVECDEKNTTLTIVEENGDVSVWNITTGTRRHRLKAGAMKDRIGVTISPNGRFLVSQDKHGVVRLWNLETAEETRRFDSPENRFRVTAFSPNSEALAITLRNRIHIVRSDGKQSDVSLLGGHTGCVTRLTFLSNSFFLSSDEPGNLVEWNIPLHREVNRLPAIDDDDLSKVLLVPNSHCTSFARLFDKWGNSRVHEIETGRVVCYLGAEDRKVVSPDDRILAVLSSRVRLLEVATGKALALLPKGHDAKITSITFSPDRESLVTGAEDGTVIVWDWKNAVGLREGLTRDAESWQIHKWWGQLGSDDVALAFRRMKEMIRGGAKTVEFIKERFGEVNRCHDSVSVEHLIARSCDSDRAKNEIARKRLLELGFETIEAVRVARAKEKDPKACVMLDALLASPDIQQLSAARRCQLRAIQILEEIGSIEAYRLLQSLSTASDTFLGHPAGAAASRLRCRYEGSDN